MALIFERDLFMKKTKVSLITKKNNYYAVVTYYENGERKVKWISLQLKTSAPKKEVKARLQEIEDFYEGLFTISNETLFTKYLAGWVERRKGLVENSTWEGIQLYAHKHIIPYFEPIKLKLRDLSPAHIQDYYNFKHHNGRCDGKEGGLSIESIIKHKSVLMTALDDAVVDGLISKNPAQYAKLPAKRSSNRKENFLTAEQAVEMLELFEETPFYAIVYTTLFYGLRKSEALGLKWSSIDFANDTLTLENVVVKNQAIEEKATMKTSASYHTYPLIPNVKRVLVKQRFWQNENRAKFGKDYIESNFVFTWEDGRSFRPDCLYRSFQRVLKRNNFTPILRFHDLRHSTASMLYARGWDMKDIQMWLRHADIKVTADIYTHIEQNFSEEIPDYLQNVFVPTPRARGVMLELPTEKK